MNKQKKLLFRSSDVEGLPLPLFYTLPLHLCFFWFLFIKETKIERPRRFNFLLLRFNLITRGLFRFFTECKLTEFHLTIMILMSSLNFPCVAFFFFIKLLSA